MTTKEMIEKSTINGSEWEHLHKFCEEMVRNNISHTDRGAIKTKVLIIGRSFAATVERRKINNELSTNEFYNLLADKLAASDIDEKIKSLQKYDGINDNNIQEIMELHTYLCDIIYEVSGKRFRSFASKYLNFHLPNLYFIYDSIVLKNIASFDTVRVSYPKDYEYDKDYYAYYMKARSIQTRINEQENVLLSPRSIDNLLYL
jgi:hypothetical protein